MDLLGGGKCGAGDFTYGVLVSDRKGQGQPACQGEWKMCRKKRRIVMPM
jgi:hypothetical protein